MITLLSIDKAIIDVNDAICANIEKLGPDERGLLSQNILGQIRNLVEIIAVKAYSNGRDEKTYNYKTICNAINYTNCDARLNFLNKFHKLLQKSVSHYTMDRGGSERLMLKYYDYLLKLKSFANNQYGLNILYNIEKFPMDNDNDLSNYYSKIASRIEKPSENCHSITFSDRYYIKKVKPFFVNQKVYYEVTFSSARSNISKYERLIAYTNMEIVDYYACKLSIYVDTIEFLNKNVSILIINNFEVSIRPCEFENFYKIFGIRVSVDGKTNEYKNIMNFLTNNKYSLSDIVRDSSDFYNYFKKHVLKNTKSHLLLPLLDKCRKNILNGRPGANVLSYLLHNMNNKIIRLQLGKVECKKLSKLYLDYGCIPFDNMPYCTSLLKHNPKLYDLLESIPIDGREHELFARYIRDNVEIDGILFTSKKEIEGFSDIESLSNKYNNLLYDKHENRKLEEYKGYIYFKKYIDDVTEIIKTLQQLALSGIEQYTPSVDSWIMREAYTIDDEMKKTALRMMFSKSHIALIYGSAGTGKTTLIKHIANFWANKEKIFLANTYPAVDNMMRKTNVANSRFYTTASFLSNKTNNFNCDVLFIDECSTISNDDMRKILSKAKFKLLVLVGDIYQIESIEFGNWFRIAKKFLPSSSTIELTEPYRTSDKELLNLWSSVRCMRNDVLEILVTNNYTNVLNEELFDFSKEDEIILCLNYDGPYGINNINHVMQSYNPNVLVICDTNVYKVGDPILFNESNRFSPLIHNNTKGKIVGIHPGDQEIIFDIELYESINSLDAMGYDFKLIGESKYGNSIISFPVYKAGSTDLDDTNNHSTVPFQISYAISIHKAQGLEYNSIKIVATKEVEELISHSIFYTAITRTKHFLKIYWTPETEKYVLEHFKVINSNRDAKILASLSSLTINNK